MEPNSEKQSILEVALQKGSLISVSANAGTGKSYLVRAIVKAWLEKYGKDSSILTAMFNTKNMAETNLYKLDLQKDKGVKFPNWKVSTFHRLGKELLGDGYNFGLYQDNKEFLAANEETFPYSLQQKGIGAYQLVKSAVGKPNVHLIEKYLDSEGMEFSNGSVSVDNSEAAKVFAKALRMAVKDKEAISASDLLMLPNQDLQASRERASKHELVIVDEVQDTNSLQCEIVKCFIQQGATVMLVGDYKQAINGFQGGLGFQGALRNFAKDLGEFKAMHLLRTFRNKSAIVQYVNEAFKGIFDVQGIAESQGGKVVEDATLKQAFGLATSNAKDVAIIAASNAEMYQAYSEALANDIKPLHSEIGGSRKVEGLLPKSVALIKETAKGGKLDDKAEKLDEKVSRLLWNQRKSRAQIKGDDGFKAHLLAYMLCKAFMEKGLDSFSQLRDAVEGMDNLPKRITLTTVHKSKGLTFGHSFVLNAKGMLAGLQGLAQGERERAACLPYVAMTRATDGLYLVRGMQENEGE